MSTDTGKVRLPSLPKVSSGNPALDMWMRAVSERLEVREGSGNPYERVVLLRELTALGLDSTQWGHKTGTAIAGVMVQNPNGQFSRVPLDAFADEIRKTRLYRDLTLAINDAARFDGVPAEVKAILLESIADEANKRGADIQHLEHKFQSATESLAYTVQEVTAAVQGAAAGVREVSYASATANSATAGRVTQVKARIDNVPINPADILPTVYATLGALQAAVPVGVPGKFYQVAGTPVSLYRWTGSNYVLGGSGTTATVEDRMTATADRVQGALASYTIKLSAGGAVSGFGLSASEDPTGATTSDFIVQADKFSVVMPGYANVVPFSVDAAGVHINSNVIINGTMDFSSINGTTKPADNATVGATWGVNLGSQPTTLAGINPTEGTKLTGIETGATVGATSAQATIITRAGTAIDTTGVVVAKVVPTAVAGVGAGLRLGSDYMGYHDGSTWKTYMDNAGNFYLGGTSGALQWNGTTLTINGSGTFSGTLTAASLDTSGYVNVNGSSTVGSYGASGHFNSSVTAAYGVVGYGTSVGVVGAGGLGAGHGVQGLAGVGGGTGVYGYSGGTSNGWSVYAANPNNINGQALYSEGKATIKGQCTFDIGVGTSPFAITSTTVNTNLNADLLDGVHSSGFVKGTQDVTLTVATTWVAGVPAFVNLPAAGKTHVGWWPIAISGGSTYYIPIWG